MQIGELSNHFSTDFKDKHNNIPWPQIRGMRNIVAHEYGRVEVDVLWTTVTESVSQLREFCESIFEENQTHDFDLTL